MNRPFMIGLLVQALALIACAEELPIDVVEPDAKVEDPAHDHCTGALPIVQTVTPSDDGRPTNIALCPVDGGVRHLRVEGAKLPRAHVSYQIYLGLEEPIGAQDALPEGAIRLMAYGGGIPAPDASFTAGFGEQSITLIDGAAFINDGTTFCADLFDGNAERSPAIVLWVDGHKEAKCEERSSLKRSNAFAIIDAIGEAKGSIAFEKGSYLYLAAGLESAPTITLYNETVLSAEEALACSGSAPQKTTIELTKGEITNIALCPIEGGVRHLVVEGLILASSGHASAQIYIGLDEPLGAQDELPEGALRIMAYQASYFQLSFGSGSVSIPNPIFLSDGTPFCMDLFDGDEDRSPSAHLWVSGYNGADCADRTSLALQNRFAFVDAFEGSKGHIAFEKDTYFYASAAVSGSPRFTIDNKTVLSESSLMSESQ